MSRGLWFQSGAVLGASGSDYSLIQLIMKEAWEGSLGWRWGKGSPWKGAERQASHGGWRVDTQPSACPTKQVGPMRKAKDLSPQKHTHTHSLTHTLMETKMLTERKAILGKNLEELVDMAT